VSRVMSRSCARLLHTRLKVDRVIGRWLVGVVCVIPNRAEKAAIAGSSRGSRWLSTSHGLWAAWRTAPQLLKPLSSIVILASPVNKVCRDTGAINSTAFVPSNVLFFFHLDTL
jgi:hypothetical protein